MTAPAAALADLRASFPVAARWIYVNHAAVAPVSLEVAKAVGRFVRDASTDGGVHWEQWLAVRDEARAKAARLLGASPATLAFTTSTSQGLLTVAEGLDWRSGDEIVVLQDDFPANHIPWFRQQKHGVRVRVVPRSEGRVSVEAVLDAVGPRTRLVAVPSAFYDNGFRLDLVGLGRALRDTGALLCVDAIQTLGAFPLDVEEAGIDFLSADSHKWMLGLEGIGLLYVREALLEHLDPPFVSWLSVEQPFTSYEPGRALVPGARRFEYGAMPTVAVFGIDACLDMLARFGPAAMGKRILALTDRLAAGLRERGWTLTSPRESADESSGIVAGRHPVATNEEVVRNLGHAGVAATHRLGAVRFSPHAWNTEEEIDRILAALPPGPDGA